MPYTSHAELLDAVQNKLHEDTTSLPDARIDDALDLAEARIRREVRAREMESEATVSLTANTRTVALPSNFVGHRRFYLNTDPIKEIRYVTPEYFWATWMSTTTSEPDEFTVEAGNFAFGPIPGSAYSGRALIYSLTAMTSSSAPALYTNHPDLYVYAVLLELGLAYLGEEDATTLKWELRYQRAKDGVMASDRRDRHPGPAIRRRIGSVP